MDILKNSFYKVFVAENDNDVCGYAFCIIKEQESKSLCHIKTLYIDDLSADENARGKHIGSLLYEHFID